CRYWNSGFLKQVVGIMARSAPKRIERNLQSGLPDQWQIDDFPQSRQIGRFGIDLLWFDLRLGGATCASRRGASINQLLDRLGNLRQGRSAVGRGEFDSVVFRRIVRSCKVDSAIRLLQDYLVGDGRRWSCFGNHQRLDAKARQNLGSDFHET